ncbi:hypothetical protein Ancab_038654 [Ancistrocladus abbreviatus]
MENLRDRFLFHEIGVREMEHAKKYPHAKLIRLGIGDTTQPIPQFITSAMAQHAQALSTIEGYSGHGPEQGNELSDEAAVLRSFRDINELIKDMLEIKARHNTLDMELKEMRERYSNESPIHPS